MRVAFITNRPAHYRLPTFEQLAGRYDVDFFFTATKPGRWWSAQQPSDFGDLRASYVSSRTLYQILRRREHEVVISCLGGRTHLAATAAAVARSQVPFVLWVDMWFYPRSVVHAAGRPLTRNLLRRADALVSCGPHVSEWISEEVGRTAAIYEMPNAVDNDHFTQPVEPSEIARFRARHGLQGITASFVGRLEPEKGLDVLLQAVAATHEPFDLVIAGEGSLREPLTDLTAALDIADRVRFIDWLDQEKLPTLYQASDVFVFPSVSTRLVKETWGLAVNEAMSAGLPVIATDVVGAAAGGLVQEGVTGWVVPERSVLELSRALDQAASDGQARESRGEEAQRRTREYTFEAGTEAFEAALEHAVDVRGRAA